MSFVTHKQRVVILRGGTGVDRARSMQSGQELIDLLHADGRAEPIDVQVSPSGEWLLHGVVRDPAIVLAQADAAVSTLRGQYGEDGILYRELQRHAVPYFGSDPYTTGIAFDKHLSKDTANKAGLVIARHMRVSKSSLPDLPRVVSSITELMPAPYIVKPTHGASGQDIFVAHGVAELANVLRGILTRHDDVLVERLVEGKVITVGVTAGLRGQDLYTTPAIELIPTESYDPHMGDKIIPARLSSKEKEAVAEAARAAHVAAGLRDISRSDFIVTNDGAVVFLEINAVPSLAPDAPMRAGLSTLGVGMDELWHHMQTRILR